MEKKHSTATRLYWYELTEDEWYGPKADQTALIDGLINDAAALGFTQANIMVTPDAVMSISPKAWRHSVYNWRDKERAYRGVPETIEYWKSRALAAEARLKELGEPA